MMIIIIIISYDDFNYLEIDLIYFSAGPPPPEAPCNARAQAVACVADTSIRTGCSTQEMGLYPEC